jgi:hypothetical protein
MFMPEFAPLVSDCNDAPRLGGLNGETDSSLKCRQLPTFPSPPCSANPPIRCQIMDEPGAIELLRP